MAATGELELSLADLTKASQAIRTLGVAASSREEVAQRIASFLYDAFRDENSGRPHCALVRCFHTQNFGDLPPSLRAAALRASARETLGDRVRCLTLIGTAGECPDWRSRRTSTGHKAIPLESEHAVAQMPMIYQLLVQLGVTTQALLETGRRLMLDLERRTFNVFFVPEARGSRFIPAQTEFVEPFGVRSVVGYGSVLPDGEMIAVVLFWKRHLRADSVGMFRTLALSTKVAILADIRRPLFETANGVNDEIFDPRPSKLAPRDPLHLDSLTRSLHELLEIHEQTVFDQTSRLEASLAVQRNTSAALAHNVSELDRKNEELNLRNRELDEFSYIASHDLQEPLRKLCSYCELLQSDLTGEISEAAQTDIHFIVDAAQRMQVLVQDLLQLSRTSRQDLKPRMVSLEDCIEKALHSLSSAITEAHAQVLCDRLPPVFGDPTLLTHLYQNLIGNAVKFRDANRAPIIHLTYREDDAGRSIFGVRDNGIGIAPAYREQVFAPFKRLHGRGEYPGSGIGLAICRRAVERLGGVIWVDEAEDAGGSHFQFTLKIQPDSDSTPGEARCAIPQRP